MSHRSAKLMPDAPRNVRAKSRRDSAAADAPRTARIQKLFLNVLWVAAAALFYSASYVFLRWIPSGIALNAVLVAFPFWCFLDFLLSRRTSRSESESASAAQRKPASAEEPGNDDQDEEFTASSAPGSWKWILAYRRRLLRSLNVLIFLFVLDATFSPHLLPSHYEHNLHIFRAVPLGHTRVRLHVRFPYPFGEAAHLAALTGAHEEAFPSAANLDELDPAFVLNPYSLRVVYREAPLAGDPLTDNRWERGPLLRITQTRDWTATTTLSDLWPATTYEWTLAFAHNHTRPSREEVHTFTTFPDPRMPRPKLSSPPPLAKPSVTLTAEAPTHEGLDEFTSREEGRSVLEDPYERTAKSHLTTETINSESLDEWNQTRPYPLVERPLPVYPANAPLDDPYHFVFGSASCVKPDVPWKVRQFKAWSWALRLAGISDARRNQIKGLELLADRATQGGMRFFLQLGDWVYADVPMFSTLDRTRSALLSYYRNLYRVVYATMGWQQLSDADLPFYGVADDHEVLNNWSGNDPDPEKRKAVRYGLQAWFEYVGMANPRASSANGEEPLDEDEVDQDALDEALNAEIIFEEILSVPDDNDPQQHMDSDDSWADLEDDEEPEEETEVRQAISPPPPENPHPDSASPLPEAWYDFRYGDTSFFVFDARRYREPPKADGSGTVLGEKQTDAFLHWLQSTNDSSTTFKFVVSSFPFTSLWAGGMDVDARTDSWAAYLQERDFLLEKMASVPNVIMLSGDRHEFVAAALAPKKSEDAEREEAYDHWPVLELSTSPLNMFYLPIRTAKQEHGRGVTGQEQLIKYLPDGNIKWTEFEVDTRDPAHPVVHTVLFIDGKPAWAADILGTPVFKSKPSPVQALGQAAKSLLEWLGFKVGKWF